MADRGSSGGPDSAEWRALIDGTAALEAGSAGELLAPPARTARHKDTEHLRAHAAPVPLFPQLVPGDIERPPASASAKAAAHPQAASNGGPGAPHPVDALHANARGLAASLTSAGLGIGRATARWMQAAGDRPIARRALALADQWTEGAARAWTVRARGWADGAARRAMAFRDRMAGLDATDQLERLPTSGGAPMSDELSSGGALGAVISAAVLDSVLRIDGMVKLMLETYPSGERRRGSVVS